MHSLLIETSTEQGLLAIFKEGKLLFQGNLPPGYQNSKYLLPEIDRALKALNLQIPDFERIAVGIGPGSYTGIRVGVITAKTLAFAAKLPLIGLCTLELWEPITEGKFAMLIDAKIGGVYLIAGEKHQGTITYSIEPQICELHALGQILAPVRTILTPKRQPLEHKLNAHYPQHHWTWVECGPSPERMDTLATAKFRQGAYCLDGRMDILYLRKTQAEIERDLKKSTS